MKQSPSNLKYRKYHKPSFSFTTLSEMKNNFPLRGKYALASTTSGRLNVRQIEAGRRAIRRQSRKKGFVSIRVFTYVSLTKKSIASRMGKGKGAPSLWVSPIKRGQVIYEVGALPEEEARYALLKAGDKMPFKTRVISLTY